VIEAVPTWPAKSVCVAVTVFAPSGEERVSVAENAPALHEVLTGAVIPPVRATVRPVWHVPEIANAEFSYEFAVGRVIVTVGPTVNLLYVIEAVPTLPA